MKIFFVTGVRSGEELEFSIPEITVGRELDNVLELPVDGVSRYHGKIVRENGGWSVVDLGSTNGVKVNRKLITEKTMLKEGDLIEFGDQMLRVTELSVAQPKVSFTEILDAVDSSSAPSSAPIAPAPIVFTPIEEPKVAPQAVSAPVDAPKTTAAVPAPKPEEKSGEKPAADTLGEWRDLLKKGGDKMFAAGKKKQEKEKTDGVPSSPRKKFFNAIFYLAIFCIVVSGVMVFYQKDQSRGKGAGGKPAAAAKDTFVLRYVKENLSKDNIFRFELVIENDTARFVIDDVKSNRKYETQPKTISEESLATLKSDLETSGFLTLEKQEKGFASDNLEESRSLLIVFGGKRNAIAIVNTSAPRSFIDAEDAIKSFAELYGMQTIALTPQELVEQAETSYRKGGDLFDNWQAERTNLRNSIQYLQLAVSYLDQFTPKPPVWDKARKKLEQAKNLQKKQLQELKSERAAAINMGNLSQVREVLLQIMDVCDMDSKLYYSAKNQLIKVDANLRRAGKGRKK